jgi:hypothetical protein
MVSVAGAMTRMLWVMEWVTPFPAHVSSAVMLLEWVTTVPFGVPHEFGAVTVTWKVALWLVSSLLIAVMA